MLLMNKICSQEYFYAKNYSIKDGLPSNNIYAIEKDKKGFLWITTDKGLSRYDSRNFKTFTTENGLATNDNFSMLIDSKDNVWLYSFKNITKIGKYEKISFLGNTNNTYRSFLINDNDEIYFSVRDSNFNSKSFGSFSSIIINEDIISRIREPSDADWEKYSALHLVRDNKFYFIIYELSNAKIHSIYELKKSDSYNLISIDEDFELLTERSESAEYIQYNDSISILFGKSTFRIYNCGKPIYFDQYPQGLEKITKQNIINEFNVFLIPLNRGLYSLTIKNGTPIFNLIIEKNNITDALMDTEQNIWISTFGDGIFKYDKYVNFEVERIKNEKGFIKIIDGIDANIIWWGSSNKKVGNIAGDQIYTMENMVDLRFIKPVNKKIFIGVSNSLYLNGEKKIHLPVKGISLYKDSIAVSTGFGILFFPLSNYKFLYNYNYDLHSPIMNINVRSNAILLLGNLFYAGNMNGLFWGRPSKDELIPICLDESIENVSVNSIQVSTDGKVWVSTEGYGVYVLENKVPIRHFYKQLLDGNIHSMKIDEKDNVWISTRKGLNKIEKVGNNYLIKKYTSYHGLPSDYIFDSYCYDNILYAATDEGLVKVNINGLDSMDFSAAPPVYITSCHLAFDEKRFSLYPDSIYILKNNQNNLSFRYTGISFRSNGNVTFEYRLKPLMDNYTFTSNDNVTFNNLKSGDYTFEVRAINSIGTKSTVAATFTFTIEKKLTQTIWFITLIICSAIFIISYILWLFFNYKRNKTAEKLRTERLIIELKLKSLQSQLNPHFIFNALSAIQQFINTENKKSANDYLSRFARLIRLYLTGSESQFIALTEELEVLKLYCKLEHLRFEDRFRYEILIDQNIDLEKYEVPALLLQPHVENAIRHGLIPSQKDDNFLSVQIKNIQNGVLCIIEDNGIGRARSMELNKMKSIQHLSMGNNITNKRLELIRLLKLANISEQIFDVTDSKGNIAGTKIEIQILNKINKL